jgi:hypothetical protein
MRWRCSHHELAAASRDQLTKNDEDRRLILSLRPRAAARRGTAREVPAKFLADILNLEAGPEWGHFVPIKIANSVTLDFDTREEFRPGHYALPCQRR